MNIYFSKTSDMNLKKAEIVTSMEVKTFPIIYGCALSSTFSLWHKKITPENAPFLQNSGAPNFSNKLMEHAFVIREQN